MNKFLIIWASIFIGFYLLFSALDQQGEFALEKRLWKINKQFEEVTKDPDVVPDQKFDHIIDQYTQMIKNNPDSKLVERIILRIGEVYVMRKNYEMARVQFRLAVEKYPLKKELSAEAIYRVGQTYEITNEWSKAKKTYDEVIEKYPKTIMGLTIPTYIAQRYKSKGESSKSLRAYDQAITYYTKVAADNPDTSFGFDALRFLATCYLDQEQWSKAVEALGNILMEYSSSQQLTYERADRIIKTINVISAYQIKDYEVPIKLYNKFINQYPEHALSKYLQQMIDAFGQLKDKGVQVQKVK